MPYLLYRVFFPLILMIVGIWLTLIWFGWHLLLVLFLLTWANNISMKDKL